MRERMVSGIVMSFWLGVVLTSGTIAAEVPFELGTLGEITTWLTIKAPDGSMDKDPFESMGGEAKYAAMEDPKMIPSCGNALEIPGATPGEKIRIGDSVWEATKMVLPDMPGIWNELPRLAIPDGTTYAYCRLDSPRGMKANLLMGLNRNGGKCKLYLNGTDLGTFDGGWGFESAREVPIDLREGHNHLLARFFLGTSFACRLVGEYAEPLKEVIDTINAPNAAAVKAPETAPVPENQKFSNLAKEIPVPAPAEHPEFLGAHLARTVSLLESGKYTHRPVRIVFDGQSIEAGWTDLFIRRLRERYPETRIIAENRAIGGWFVWRMQKLLKHDILRWQPDLVLFSAYQGTAEVWERFLSEIRSETTADIIIRTQHIDGGYKPEYPRDGAESKLLRRLAQKYDVELVEVNTEWLDYLNANNMVPKDLLRDGVHLNAKGDILMALLYDRHFRYNAAIRAGWAATVRRFDVGRFLEDNKTDEIVLDGDGWFRQGRGFAQSRGPNDKLTLKFRGTRVDLVMPTTHGRATVLIDGRKPSELNLYHGTRPQGRTMADTDYRPRTNFPMTYHTGTNMQEETWVLAITAANADEDPKKANLRLKFRLTGSKTGFDGEGQNDRKFVSTSGRITILPSDWETTIAPPKPEETAPVMSVIDKPVQWVWHILPDGLDAVSDGPGWVKDTDYYSGQPYEYLTIADGLSCGIHELTLTAVPDGNRFKQFVISGVDVHCPPLRK